MSDQATPSENANRVRAALAALAPEDPARQAFEGLVQQLDATIKGPIITGGVSSGRDANIATVQIFNTAPPTAADAHAIHLAWLDQLANFYGEPDETAPVASAYLQPLLDDLRLRLASGVMLWTADPPPVMPTDLEARSRVALLLWPLIAAPLTYGPWRLLPIRWPAAAEALFGPALTQLVVEHQRQFHQLARDVFYLRLLNALTQPQYRGGLQRLIADLRNPALGGAAIVANRLTRQVPRELVPPAAVAQATPLRLIAAGAVGALAGAGTIATLDLAVHHGDTMLSLLRRLVEQLQPPSAHAAESVSPPQRLREVAVNLVRTSSGPLSIPISFAQWRDELNFRDTQFGQHGLRAAPVPYWCYVPGGSYRIGGWKAGEPAATVRVKPFWIARVPITVAQFQPFVAQGYAVSAKRWWTSEGWKWKNQHTVNHPENWGITAFSRESQPVIGTSWYETTAFCAWLAKNLSAAIPWGYTLRLPSEAEWEVAAAYDRTGQRRIYPWGEAAPTPERAVYDQPWQKGPPNVGTCPAGAAACGAFDLAGTVWEWCASGCQAYPESSMVIKADCTPNEGGMPVRGGAYWDNEIAVRCERRDWNYPGNCNIIFGFRIVVTSRSP